MAQAGEFAHVAIDDHSRAGFVQMHEDERKGSAVAFLKAAVQHYEALGVKVHRLLRQRSGLPFQVLQADLCSAGYQAHLHQAVPPADHGKVERYIQTCPREWAHGRIWNSSQERTEWLPAFLTFYNTRRPHSTLGDSPPASRLGGTNLLNLHS
jgi:hypothetical protein